MNKNTIVKLIAVLAMCFLIGGALVACKGAAGPAGPQGPQGEKGETGAAGSTPVLTIGANGNWFADGVDLGVKAPSADAACTEHDFAFIDVVKHTQTEDGVVVKACKSCGYAAITNETLHVMEAGEIPANCLEAKWVGEFCSVCNLKGEGEFVGAALGHDWTKAQPVTDTNNDLYICIDGGMLVQHCKACKEIQYTTVEAGEYPHTIYNWSIIAEPTEDNYGTAYGTCTICGENETYDLPLITSDEWAVKVLKEFNCGQDGKLEYTYVNAARNMNLSFKVDVAATGHKLNGQNYANYDVDPTDDVIVVSYWYGVADAAGRLPALNIKPFAGQKFVCGAEQSGYFYCEECEDVVNVVVYYDHNGKCETVVPATCCSDGSKKVDCDNCTFDSFAEGGQLVTVPALPHVYTYELVEVGTADIDGDEVKTYDLVGTCKGNGVAECTYITLTAGESLTAPATNVLAEDIYNVSEKALKAPNCLEFGQIKYTFNKVGADAKYTETVLVPKTNHILNGKEVLDYTALTTATAGIKAFTNNAFKNVVCEAPVDAYFICEYCSTVDGVESVVSVTVTKAHTKTNVRTDVAADCVTAGSILFDCSNANCQSGANNDGKDISAATEALGHDFKYVIVDNGEAAQYRFTVNKVCCRVVNDVACTETELVGNYNNLTKIAEVAPTCYSEGYTLYKVQIGNAWDTLPITYAPINHTLAGLVYGSPKFNALYVNSTNDAVYSTTPGIKVFANETLACEQSVDGYYECEVCKELVNGVQVYQAHVVKEVIVPATCETTGTAKCANADHEFVTDALGHSYDLDYSEGIDLDADTVTIEGKCNRTGCLNETEWTFNLPDYSNFESDDFKAVYGKAVEVKKATCVESAKYALTVNFDADGNAIALADIADSVVFVTVTFEIETAPNGHDWNEDSLILAVEKEEIIDEETGETAKFYYMVIVCDDCGTYYCAIVFDAEEYAEYLEHLAENA